MYDMVALYPWPVWHGEEPEYEAMTWFPGICMRHYSTSLEPKLLMLCVYVNIVSVLARNIFLHGTHYKSATHGSNLLYKLIL